MKCVAASPSRAQRYTYTRCLVSNVFSSSSERFGQYRIDYVVLFDDHYLQQLSRFSIFHTYLYDSHPQIKIFHQNKIFHRSKID